MQRYDDFYGTGSFTDRLYMALNQIHTSVDKNTGHLAGRILKKRRAKGDFSWGVSDHLSYLEDRLPIFEDEYEKKIGRKNLVCASCGHLVTKVSEKIRVLGRHDHSFGNLGYLVKLGCFRNAPGCFGIDRISFGYSWFRGFSWQIQLCRQCYTQLGWKYMDQDESFYGLIFGMLREEEPEEDRGPDPD